jgi:hypothetical protein
MFFTSQSIAMAGENTEALLTCFFTGCEEHFGFLNIHGFSFVSGLSEYRKGRRVFTPFCAPCTITAPFEAVALYEKNGTSFEIAYSGEHYTLDFHICYGHVHRFLLRDVFKAARKPAFMKLDSPRAPTIAALENALQNAGKTVRKNTHVITEPNPKLIERTLTMHEKLVEEKVRAHYRRDMDQATQLAARAFAAKDYTRVIEILSPYERGLNAASLKKLDLARKILINP